MKTIVMIVGLLMFLHESAALGQAKGKTERGSTQQTAYADPYDFKGIRLGIKLSEFKAAPIPQDGEQARYNKPDAVNCANPDAAGLVKCSWGTAKDSMPEYGYESVTIAGRLIAMHSFEFIAMPGDAEPRLFRMSFHDHGHPNAIMANFEAFGAALVERFGQPTSVQRQPMENAFGAVFEKQTRLWTNKTGKIALVRFEPSLAYNTLRYFIPQYVDYHDARWTEEQKRKGSKL